MLLNRPLSISSSLSELLAEGSVVLIDPAAEQSVHLQTLPKTSQKAQVDENMPPRRSYRKRTARELSPEPRIASPKKAAMSTRATTRDIVDIPSSDRRTRSSRPPLEELNVNSSRPLKLKLRGLAQPPKPSNTSRAVITHQTMKKKPRGASTASTLPLPAT